MPIFDCSREMNAFHNEEVTLPTTEQREMRERRNAGRTRLRTGLERDGHQAPTCRSQGSYAMHTMVQDDDCDYDIDDGAYFDEDDLLDANGQPLTPRQSRERVRDALAQDDRLAQPAGVHRNCVRQLYAAGYHIDIPVYRVTVENPGEDNESTRCELASADSWQESDARAVTSWFKAAVAALNKEEDNGDQMRRLVRLTKAFARSRKDWKEKTCSGIVLSRLVVDEFAAAVGRDDTALRDTWTRIEKRLRTSQRVEHPVTDSNLAEDGDAAVLFFRRKLADALATLAILDAGCTRGEARAAWDSVFDTDFFVSQPDPSDDTGSGPKSAFIATGSTVDRRDDGGGRYG